MNAGWRQKSDKGIIYFQSEAAADLGSLVHAFSTRRGGYSEKPYASLNLGFRSGDLPERVVKNRELLLSVLSADTGRLRTVRQVHSNRVIVAKFGGPEILPADQADAMATDIPGLLLGILTADCYPVLIADPKRRVVASVHAGWRGTANGIIRNTVSAMLQGWECREQDIISLIGPGIGSCCYQVGVDVYWAFIDANPEAVSYFLPSARANQKSEPRWMLDLAAANRDQLLACGILPENIHVLGACTVCLEELFFSYRRDGAATGRMLSFIGLKKE